MNAFIRSHRVMRVEKQCFPEGWAFCVCWMDGEPPSKIPNGAEYRKSEKIDYMEVLPPEQFAKFSRMRAVRKEIADKGGLRSYEVATDAQLAEIAKMENPTLAGLKKIKNFGNMRVERYGKALIEASEKATEAKTEESAATDDDGTPSPSNNPEPVVDNTLF